MRHAALLGGIACLGLNLMVAQHGFAESSPESVAPESVTPKSEITELSPPVASPNPKHVLNLPAALPVATELSPPVAIKPDSTQTELSPPESAEQADIIPSPAIETTDLKEPDLQDRATPQSPDIWEGAGDLDAAHHGLPLSLWQNADRGLVLDLLNRMPENMPSGAGRSMLIRALLSRSTPPDGEGNPPPAFLRTRLQTLQRLGLVQSAASLALALPPEAFANDEIARLAMDILLTSHQSEAACLTNLVRQSTPVAESAQPDTKQPDPKQEDPHWLKRDVYCQYVGGDKDGAELQARILHEKGIQDPEFYALFDALLTQTPVPSGIEAKTPLHQAMLHRLGGTDSDIPKEAEALLAKWRGMKFTDGAGGAVVANTNAGRARLLQGLESTLFDARAPWYKAAAFSIPSAGSVEAEIWSNVVSARPPIGAMVVAAPEIARLIYGLNRGDDGDVWAVLIAEKGGAAERERLALIWPLQQVARDSKIESEPLQSWISLMQKKGHAESLPRMAVILNALDAPVPGEILPPETDLALKDAALDTLLEMTVAKKRAGETLLLCALALSEDGVKGTSDAALVRMIKALKQVGLESEARRLASEALAESLIKL